MLDDARVGSLSERYQRLLVKLAQLDGEGDKLQASMNAVAAVVHFLREDPAVMSNGLCAPLTILVNACDDTLKGVRSPLFDRRRQGRAGGTNADLMRGQLAAALDGLIGGGLRTNVAARWLALQAAEWGITLPPKGEAISASQVLRWRENVLEGIANPRVAKMVLLVGSPPHGDLGEIKNWAKGLLAGLKKQFPGPPIYEGR